MKFNKRSIWFLRSLSFLILGLSVNSCDVTEVQPKSTYTDDNFWSVREHAEASVIGIYDALQPLGDDFIAWGEARADLVQPGWGTNCCSSTDVTLNFGLLQYNNITDVNRYTNWSPFYQAINRANVVITNTPKVVETDPDFSERDSDYLVGEARYLRALSYWWMARVFKDVPLVTEPTTSDMDFMVQRTSQEKILDFVEQELNEIITNEHLRQQFGTDLRENTSRATLPAARALLADVALWRNKYDVVIDQTTEIIENPRFSLQSSNSWYDNFSPGMTGEIIFQLLYDRNYNDRNQDTYTLSGNVGMVPSTYLRDLHESPNNLAYRDNVRGNGKTWVWENAYHYKWLGESAASVPENRVSARENTRGSSGADPNYIFYRLAEIYLMRAEAYNHAGQKDEAINDINTVRERAILPEAIIVSTRNDDDPVELTAAATTDQIEDAILEERAMELAGEGKRWFTLMRMSMRGRPNLLPNVINDPTKYTYSGQWQAWADPTKRLENPWTSDFETWYIPINQQNKITNPNLLEPPL